MEIPNIETPLEIAERLTDSYSSRSMESVYKDEIYTLLRTDIKKITAVIDVLESQSTISGIPPEWNLDDREALEWIDEENAPVTALFKSFLLIHNICFSKVDFPSFNEVEIHVAHRITEIMANYALDADLPHSDVVSICAMDDMVSVAHCQLSGALPLSLDPK